MTTLCLPDLGEGLHEAEIVSWHVAVGDHVVADQPLLSVETSKAVVEIPAPWSGRVLQTFGQPGDVVPVGSPLVEIETEDAPRDAGTVVGTLPAMSSPPAAWLPSTTGRAASSTVMASPAVRKLAMQMGVDLTRLTGSGPGGALTREDVEAAVTAQVPNTDQPLRGVRRAMADVMTRAGQSIVPATVTDEAVIDEWPADVDPTIRLIRAVATGCKAVPVLNAALDAGAGTLRLNERIDVALAMETEDGLFAPVLRNIAQRSDGDLRAGIDAMKLEVRQRTVPTAELRDATITLSNFGMLGGLHAALVVVPPQVAILGAGRAHKAPRVIASDIRAVRILPLSLTFDHRAVTGAEAIRFLSAAIADLQKPSR